jgi:hypothetical protein
MNYKGGNRMAEQLATYENGLPVLADDTLIQIAKQAEARIDAVIKIKQMALKVTNAADWTDQQGKPYLQASGSEKIANLFNISWKIDEPTMETEGDGTITYVYKGEFSLAGRSIEVEGSRSSRDTFFRKYEYDKDGNKTGEKPLDRRDLKMAAMTNLLGNGITRILGIRNLTWEDLKLFANIDQESVKGKVTYKKNGQAQKPDMKAPTEKKDDKPQVKDPEAPVSEAQTKAIHAMYKKTGFEEEKFYDYIFEIIGRKVESTKALNKGEASKIIDKLNTYLNEQG